MTRLLLLFIFLPLTLSAQKAANFVDAARQNLKQGEERLAKQQLDAAGRQLLSISQPEVAVDAAELYLELDSGRPVIQLIRPLLDARLGKADYYRLLAEAYIKLNKNDSARAYAQEGIRLFPQSGSLYRQLGLTFSRDLQFQRAASIWERGVQAEPNYPWNYYHLAKFYAQTAEQLWTIIYGETFILLFDHSIATRDVGRLVMAAYQQSIVFTSDSTRRILFTNSGEMLVIDGKPSPNFPLAFQSNHAAAAAKVFEEQAPEAKLNVYEITDLRIQFLDYWFSQNLQQRFPSALFDHWQHLSNEDLLQAYVIKELGYIDARAHRELMTTYRRDIEDYDAWRKAHRFEIEANGALWQRRFSTP